MSLGIAVVFYEAGLCRVDRVVPTYGAVFASMPLCAALLENDVARDYVFLWWNQLAMALLQLMCRERAK